MKARRKMSFPSIMSVNNKYTDANGNVACNTVQKYVELISHIATLNIF